MDTTQEAEGIIEVGAEETTEAAEEVVELIITNTMVEITKRMNLTTSRIREKMMRRTITAVLLKMIFRIRKLVLEVTSRPKTIQLN